ncbi:MAG: hypothetical protein KDA77_03220 [Planctomycetaceae bacterium]|nr:hypothetical protein [Planctomycetaceae bacterium]
MTTRLDFTWVFILLMVLILVPTIILAIIKLFRDFSFGSFLASVAVLIMGGSLLVVLAIILPHILLRPQVLVPAEAVISDSFSRNIPAKSVVASPPVIPDPFWELPVVARKPYDQKPEIPVPAGAQESKALDALPEWVVSGLEHTRQNQDDLLESSPLVVESGLFVTMDEAQYDALTKAGLKLKANLQLRYPQYPLAALEISPDEVRQVALRRSYYQLVKHNFGDVLKSGEPLKQNMYRAYLEFENSPRVRETLFARWKQKIGNERTAWLGGGFGLVTLLCAGVAVYLRVTHPPATMKSL